MKTKPEIGKAYHIYGRMGDMKRMRPIGGGNFCTNLIYAEIFTMREPAHLNKLEDMLERLKRDNGGEWELREVDGWVSPQEYEQIMENARALERAQQAK